VFAMIKQLEPLTFLWHLQLVLIIG
jgi:hypothetical protein